MYSILNDRLVTAVVSEVTDKTEPMVLPADTNYTLSQLEHDLRQLDPGIKGTHNKGIALDLLDGEDKPLAIVPEINDLTLDTDYSDFTLDSLRQQIYERVKKGKVTKLVYYVYIPGVANARRLAVSLSPTMNGESVHKWHLTWKVDALLADGEEIARLCRILNRHGLYLF